MSTPVMPNPAVSKPRSHLLPVLCVLTIWGNLLIILKGLFTYYALYSTNDDRREGAILLINVFYALELLTCVGSILGAVIMLNGKKTGLILYQISSIAYMVITFVFTIICFFSIIGIPVAFLQIIYLIPSIIFFILYMIFGKHLS
ncbi:MAG: hypothetical protein MH137_11540 [Flavobacteriales bacterium]|nr:hypothetical protein [Flavobacteriales bacterium]